MNAEAAVIAPVEATPSAATPTTPVAPQPAALPTSAVEARRLLVPDAAQRNVRDAMATLGVTHPSADQPRNEAGQFVSTDAPLTDAATAPAEEASAPEPAALAPGLVRIDIPAGHPLAHRTDALIVPAEAEEYARWAVNNAVRREQIVEWESYAKAQEARAIEAEAALRAHTEVVEADLLDPKTQHMLRDMARAYGPEYAEALKRGLIGDKLEQRKQEIVREISDSRLADDAERTAQQFVNSAYAEAVNRFPEWTQHEFDAAMSAYGSYMEARGQEVPDLGNFVQFATSLYIQKPEVQSTLQQQRAELARRQEEQTRIEERKRLEAEELARIEAAAAARRNNPFGRVPASAGVPASAIPSGGAATAREAFASLTGRRPR